MIKGFAHKGLEDFFHEGTVKGIQPKHAAKLGRLLDRLDAAGKPADMDFPGSALHPLKGDRRGYWAVKVSGNWRVVFRFEDGNAFDVSYLDYH
jgi:proteic killer suppression protein